MHLQPATGPRKPFNGIRFNIGSINFNCVLQRLSKIAGLPHKVALERLELYDAKVSHTVLRGEGQSNLAFLFDTAHWIVFSQSNIPL